MSRLTAVPTADVDGLDVGVPLTVVRREAASIRESRAALAGADGDLTGVAAAAVAAREEDSAADG